MLTYLRRRFRFVVFATTFGSMVEWYDAFLFIYWSPSIFWYFFNTENVVAGTVLSIAFGAIGFLSRPIGGVLFGLLGDSKGRRTSFISTIALAVVPNVCMVFIPSFAQIGIWSPIFLLVLRLIQGISAGGEIPGTICYLAESSIGKNQESHLSKVTSFAFYGVEIGILLALLHYTIFGNLVDKSDNLHSTHWKYSFVFSSLICLFGVYFRKKLRETWVFEKLEEERVKNNEHISLFQAIKTEKKRLILAFFSCFLATVGFFCIAEFPGLYLNKVVGLTRVENSILVLSLLIVSILTMPMFGALGDKFGAVNLLKISAVTVFIFSIASYFMFFIANTVIVLTSWVVLILMLNVHFALIPSFLASLFPPEVRYSCLGISFNSCDSLIGGIVPLAAYWAVKLTGVDQAFMFLLPCAVVCSYLAIAVAEQLQKKSNELLK